jgi:ribosomal protein S18 acetylase RimI-like enzyme
MSGVPPIDRARPDEWLAAFELAYQQLPGSARHAQVLRALQLLGEGAIDVGGIWVARQDERIAGVQIAVPLGGACWLFWLPETRDRGNVILLDALVEAALAECRRQGGKLAQTIVPPEDARRAEPLLRQGFTRVTQLLYLEHNLHELSALPHLDDAVRFEPFSDANAPAFRQALQQSYVQTLDCPEINGVRTIDEVLAGYRGTGPARLAPWWLIRAGDEPAGVVVLTTLPEGPAWDLSYVGILPQHRNRGIGRGATSRVLHAACAAGMVQVQLAVDVRNDPARRLYQALGFVPTVVRDVYLHFLNR